MSRKRKSQPAVYGVPSTVLRGEDERVYNHFVNEYRRAYAPRNRPELDATEGCANQEWILNRAHVIATRAIEHEIQRQNVRGFSNSPAASALDQLTAATVAVLDNSRSVTLLARQISDMIRNQQSYAGRLEGRAKRWDLDRSPRIAREPVTINPEKQPPAPQPHERFTGVNPTASVNE